MTTNAQRRRTARAAAKAERMGMTAEDRTIRERIVQGHRAQANVVYLGPAQTKPVLYTRAQRRGHR